MKYSETVSVVRSIMTEKWMQGKQRGNTIIIIIIIIIITISSSSPPRPD
jgi:hypothetical protein